MSTRLLQEISSAPTVEIGHPCTLKRGWRIAKICKRCSLKALVRDLIPWEHDPAFELPARVIVG
jgi:hypothetical protein